MAEKKKRQKKAVMGENPEGARAQRAAGKCCFFVARKRRYCKFTSIKGGDFCGNHIDCAQSAQKRQRVGNAIDGERVPKARVPCPHNPNHTVWKHKLAKHILVCPDRFKAESRGASGGATSASAAEIPHFSRDINSGSLASSHDLY